jgi:hypothetical protein
MTGVEDYFNFSERFSRAAVWELQAIVLSRRCVSHCGLRRGMKKDSA